MALVTCPECGKPVSTEAKSCPACGYPIAERLGTPATPAVADAETEPETAEDNEAVLLAVRPSWWNYGWHLLFAWLLIPWLVAWYRRRCFQLRIYPDRVTVEEGFWSKETSEFFIKDIRSVEVRQGVWDRLIGIGDVSIATAAAVEASEVAFGVPDPHGIKNLLISRRQRLAGSG